MKYSVLKKHIITLLCILFIQTNTSIAEVRTLNFQNTERLFWINENEISKASKPKPLLVHLHGFRKREIAIDGRETLDYILWDSLKQVAQVNDFILIQPAALAGQWRLFPGVKNVFLENGEEVDDVGFIFSTVKKLVEDGIADPTKIYLTGISDGAIMAYHLLCQSDSPFAAAVTIVGSMYEKHLENCDLNTRQL